MINRANRGKSPIVIVLAIAIVVFSTFGISLPKQIEEELAGVTVKLGEGIEIIRSRSYEICSSVKWNEIKAAGIKVTETSLKGFLQICERLALDLGDLQIYVDVEARVMWVYSDSSKEEADTEAYYLQFTQ